MPRPGTSSGGHRSSGGHSSSRVSGGHHVGQSSRPTGGSSFNRGPSINHYHNTSPYRRGYYRNSRHGYTGSTSGLGTLIVCIIIIFAIIVFSFFMISNNHNKVVSTINREKIENRVPYNNNCIKDELGYIENSSRLSKNLMNFYNKTGVPPYIYLKSYDSTLIVTHKLGMKKILIMKVRFYSSTMRTLILMKLDIWLMSMGNKLLL